MQLLMWTLVVLPGAFFLYAYVLYPVVLQGLLVILRTRPLPTGDPEIWPSLTVLVPAHDEEGTIRGKLENLLAADYPRERLHVLVVSDASTDRTEEIVREFEDRGVELLRLEERVGKIGAQNAAVDHLRGDLVVSTDASTRIPERALKNLVRPFQDPTVGVASGHNVSVGRTGTPAAAGESAYVTWEMWVRSMETALGSIVGASGAFFAVRRELFSPSFPGSMSRDFGSVLIARRRGYRAVSVSDAPCRVPRSRRIHVEYRRKVRTMSRGLATLFAFSDLLDPFRYGLFAVTLASHKLARWLVFLTWPLGLGALVFLAGASPPARGLMTVAAIFAGLGLLAIGWQRRVETRSAGGSVPRIVAGLSYLLVSGVAGGVAWWEAIRGTRTPIWEPTQRDAVEGGEVPEQGA